MLGAKSKNVNQKWSPKPVLILPVDYVLVCALINGLKCRSGFSHILVMWTHTILVNKIYKSYYN